MKNTLFCLSFLMFLTVSCNKESEKKQALIDQEVKINIESFRQRKRNECRSMVIDSANRLADSIVLARNTVVDTALVNGKPKKPTKPIIHSTLDTTPVEPLFKK
jgi:hypothetical protein